MLSDTESLGGFELSPWKLRFGGATETAFQRDYFVTTLLRTRLGILLGLIFYSSFYILDMIFLPDLKSIFFAIRFYMVGPIIVALLILSLTRHYAYVQQAVNSFGILAAGGGIVAMTMIRPEYTINYYSGIILVLIYAYHLMGIRFYWASGAAWIVVLSYIVGIVFFTDLPMLLYLPNFFFLLGANLLLMFGAYFIEILRRQDFFLRYQLDQEQHKIEAFNVSLENIVAERTAALREEVAERQEAQRISQLAVQEREVLLKEVYHRTKNNMNVIISLLNLQEADQAQRPSDTVFQQLAGRIKSMALVHEQLYGSENLATIALDKYLLSLVISIKMSLIPRTQQVRIEVNSVPLEIGLDQAVPLGLAVNEIITNAIRHGFPDGRDGRISLDITSPGNNEVRLVIWNDGVPFPDDIPLEQRTTLGLRLVQLLIVEQLGGTVLIENAAPRVTPESPEQADGGGVKFTLSLQKESR